MITKETFIKLVKGCAIIQNTTDGHYSYINLSDRSICPFCGKVMTSEKLESEAWQLTCSCEKAKEVFEDIRDTISSINVLNVKLQEYHHLIQDKTLKWMQDYYFNVLVPQTEAEQSKIDEEIKSLTTIRGLNESSGQNDNTQ